jgi:hypothetical protein
MVPPFVTVLAMSWWEHCPISVVRVRVKREGGKERRKDLSNIKRSVI